MDSDFLFFGGCWVLQTGNINLAFTDSIGEAMQAGKDLGFTGTPYWVSYRLDFENTDEVQRFADKVKGSCGAAYLSPFIFETGDLYVILGGYCII